MSGLAAVLVGWRPSGVHRWRSRLEGERVAAAARRAGWALVAVDTAGLERRRDVVHALVEALGASGGGHNLDALHDALRDRGGRTLLVWDGWSTLAEEEPEDLLRVTRVLARADDLEVVLRGPGPDVGLDELD